MPVDYAGLPARFRSSVARYIEHGVPTGSCWRKILESDLAAVCAADPHTFLELPAIYRWLINEAPGNCWGSPEKVEKWIAWKRGR